MSYAEAFVADENMKTKREAQIREVNVMSEKNADLLFVVMVDNPIVLDTMMWRKPA